MIGAMGRNLGKTELACQLIRRFAERSPIAALKVTTVARDDGSCPRGGDGCGTCSSLGESWCVNRELDAGTEKDTSRLLASGARASYWLRVREGALEPGARGLLAQVPDGWASVCESNSLSRIVEPGLFLQVRAADERSAKSSARAVAHLVDGVVVSDGTGFDLDLERISLVDGAWALRRDACAVVVEDAAAGPSPSSATTRWLAASLHARFAQVETAALPLARDDEGRHLSALVGALPRSRHDWCLVAPALADPFPASHVNALFRHREGVDAVLLHHGSHATDFPVGLFHRRLLPRLVAALEGEVGCARSLAVLGATRKLTLAPAGVGEADG